MITGFFIQIIAAVVLFALAILPTGDLPSGITDALVLIWSYINMFSFLFPVDTLLSVLLLAFLYHGILLLFDMALWVIGLIRGN